MKKVTLGNTGLEVSKLSMGGLFVAAGGAELQGAIDTVNRAYELGINYVDTAPGYGESEKTLGQIFKETGRPEILSTKVGGDPATFEPQNADHIKRSIENSLELLGTDYFDIVMIHEPDRPGVYDWWSDMLNCEGTVLNVLNDYKQQGVIKNIGLGGTGVTELGHLVKSGKFDVVLTAFNYSLLYQEAESVVIAEAATKGVGVVAGSPLQQGGFAKRFDAVYDEKVYWLHPLRRKQLQQLYTLCDDTGLSITEMAIRFVGSNPNVNTVLMGAGNISELEQNVAAINAGPLPEDILKAINEIAALLPCRPYGEPSGMGYRLSCPDQYKGPDALSY